METSNFGKPPRLTLGETVTLSMVTALLNVPLAVAIGGILLKLAMENRNAHLWERAGVHLLRDTLERREVETESRSPEEKKQSPVLTTKLVVCGGVAFVEKCWKNSRYETAIIIISHVDYSLLTNLFFYSYLLC